MKEKILNTIIKSYEAGNLDYILSYVDKEYWYRVLKSEVKSVHVDNLTDFSYNKCFSLFLYSINKQEMRFGSEEFRDYLIKNKYLHGVTLLISALAPYAVIKYNRYSFTNGNSKLHEQYQPLDFETTEIGENLMGILSKYRIEVLETEVLNMEVPNVTLELKEEGVTIFHCLFDNY